MGRPKNEVATDHIQAMISLGVVCTVFNANDIANVWHKQSPTCELMGIKTRAPAPISKHTINRRLQELERAGIVEKIGNCYQRKAESK